MSEGAVETKIRIISDHPAVRVAQYDYHLSHEEPLYAAVRSAPALPVILHNVHSGLELGIVLSGQEERIYSEVTIPLQDGDVWLAAMWEMHGVHCFGGDLRAIVLNFLPEFLGETILLGIPWLHLFAAPPAQRPRVAGEQMRARMVRLGEDMWEEIEQRPPGWSEAVRLHLLHALLLLARGWSAPTQVAEAPHDRGALLPRIMPVLAATYADPLQRRSLAEAAEICRLSPWHFNRLFRRAMGVSFGQFHLRARVTAGSHLLLTTNRRVESVAEECGFVDASHFHHALVKQYGATPAEYRRRFREIAGEPGADPR